ncbi:S-adenosyl-L-methionine-dependent methyltransferase [Poronia punctata]|nr:S-adenosyl-L-methionine-dependent methyltransferase [Poronia punctata]
MPENNNILTTIPAIFWSIIGPWQFMSLSASFIPQTIRTFNGLLPALSILLSSPSSFKDTWFGHFWSVVGPNVRERVSPAVLALLDGRVSKGRILENNSSPVTPHEGISGTVIEIGPASGLWVRVFSQSQSQSQSQNKKIQHVYGVEPNAKHHEALRREIANAGLQDVYEIVPVGIEHLNRNNNQGKKWDGNIEPESVDCIVSILCLCSIPDPERNTQELYRLLRPGGRWYVFEHVKHEDLWYMRFYQRIVNLVWPHFLGGCQLCRPTAKTLANAGKWTSIDVAPLAAEPWHNVVTHIVGVLTK